MTRRKEQRVEVRRARLPGGFSWRPLRTVALGGVLLAVAAGAALWAGLLRTRSFEGVDLGRLPFGVSQRNLNVLVVTLDTTRADRLGPYGFTGVQTPVLDRLAREGVVFEQAASAAPLTQPSHATLFTSRLPPAHGVRDNGAAALAEEEVTLAETLKEAGARTGAFIGAYVLDSRWGFNQGFDTYVDDFDLSQYRAISLGGIERRASDVVDSALEWFRKGGNTRFFAWLHFYDAHAPYSPPEPFRTSYAGRGYAGEIAFMDAQLGRVIAELESRGLFDRTIVVVVGDHGESLGEHGEGAHGFFLYEGVIRVPLIVRTPFPATRGRRVQELVRTVDVMPTVLDLLGMPPVHTAVGRSLAGAMVGGLAGDGAEAYSESVYPLNQFGWSDLQALRTGRYKYIDAPRPELYDLENDPAETKNLYDEQRRLAENMRQRLSEIHGVATAGAVETATIDVDPDTRARLAALGYIGTFVGASAGSVETSSLADPKDKIEVFNQINRASELSKHENRGQEAIDILDQVVAADPTVIAAWFMLGNEYVRLGQLERGIAQYRRALELKPDYDLAVTNIANTYRRMGRDEDAAAGYERLLQVSPRNAQARFQLAQIRAEQDRLEEAQALIADALALEPDFPGAHNVLGIIKFKQGDPAGATASIRSALERNADLKGAHFNLALIAEERGDFAAAIREYQQEIERHPDHYKALFNLGRVYGQVGDRPRQLDAFRRAIESNPRFAEGHLFLAKLYLDIEENFDEAVRLAERGIELNPWSEFAPLGHYVIADIYNRRGMAAEARLEAARGRARERAIEERRKRAAGARGAEHH
ncbi:MAG TPA: sulfatase-like hydrolase/transferase [Vicinamibacterales bacterium]|nr:sulfatase-like hydrolase/transferase [Vicinamibacterales bacterium]